MRTRFGGHQPEWEIAPTADTDAIAVAKGVADSQMAEVDEVCHCVRYDRRLTHGNCKHGLMLQACVGVCVRSLLWCEQSSVRTLL